MRPAASKTISHTRSLSALVLPAMLAVLLLLLPAAAAAAPLDGSPATASSGATLLLAAESGGGDGPQGPEPADPDDTENPAAPADYEVPFIWAASVGLLALAVLGTIALAGLYYLLVQRPRQKTSDRK